MEKEPITATELRIAEKEFWLNPPQQFKDAMILFEKAQSAMLLPFVDRIQKILNEHGNK